MTQAAMDLMNSATASKIVYVLAGPTAVGKTAVSIALAEKLDTCIISADSRQCYKEMSIGTAKPSGEELEKVPHYFIDAFSVEQNISAADFETLSLNYLHEIFQEHNTAVVCGGTGLYIKALTDGLDEMPAIDEGIAEEVNELYRQNGLRWLQSEVKHFDPEFYATGEIQNPARLLRALVFARSNGKSITQFRGGEKKERPFTIVKSALDLPRNVLYERINSRVDTMIHDGLVDEVKSLLRFRQLKNLQTVGYSELFDYFDGKCSLQEAIEKIKQHSRNYAKRQLTWFRNQPGYHWFAADDIDVVEKIMALKN